MRRRFSGRFVLLGLAMFFISCGRTATGTYENVNGFAVLTLSQRGNAKLTVYGADFPCTSYTVTADRVTLECKEGSMEFKWRGDQLVNTMPFGTKRFPFRGPLGTDFGTFQKTSWSSK